MSILTGYVPTPAGEAALDVAVEEARRRNTSLLVVNAGRGESTNNEKFADDAKAAQLRKRLDDSGVTYSLLRSVSSREPAEELVSMAAEREVELVVIGLRRRSPVGKLLMGSTAQRILLDAECPVLAVKPVS
ncbi:MAG: universal stress protein [Nocardioidaceae bacterium]